MKIYTLLEQPINSTSLITVNVYNYTKLDTVLEHLSNELNQPKEHVKNILDNNVDIFSGNFIYKLEETELQ